MAEGPGAELSICYQKVSGRGAIRRWPEVPLEGGRCQGHGGSRQQTEGPSAHPLTQPQFPELQSVLQGWAGHDWPYTQTRRPSDVRNRMLSLCSKIPSSLADQMRRSTVLSLEGGTCPQD